MNAGKERGHQDGESGLAVLDPRAKLVRIRCPGWAGIKQPRRVSCFTFCFQKITKQQMSVTKKLKNKETRNNLTRKHRGLSTIWCCLLAPPTPQQSSTCGRPMICPPPHPYTLQALFSASFCRQPANKCFTEALMCARHVPGACGNRKAKGTDAAVIEVFLWWKHSYPFQDADHGLACWDTGVLGDLSHCQLGGKPGRVSAFVHMKQ